MNTSANKISKGIKSDIVKQIFLTGVLILVLYGCTKPKPGNGYTPGAPACRIVTVIDNLSKDTIHVAYNNSGKISNLSGKKSATIFEYAGNVTTITRFAFGVFDYKTIINSNAAGLPLNVRFQFNESGTRWENEAYEYNGEEVSGMLYTVSSSSTRITTAYTWQNQNVFSRSNSRGESAEYKYYTDKPKQDGDYLWMDGLFDGYDPFRNKNLIKSFTGVEFTYEFDAKGRVVTVLYSSAYVSPTVVYRLEYECK